MMKVVLIGLILAVTALGCASDHHAKTGAQKVDGQNEARTVRGLTDAMASPANRYPSDRPR